MATAIISRVALIAACTAFFAAAPIAQAGAKMPPGAFLHQPAPDIATLNRQVQNDPLVAARYARLYNMSPGMVRAAFSKMRLSTLTEDQVFEVHYVHAGEKIGYKVRRVRKGTAIYRMPDGTPALVRVCGNPIKTTRPKAVKGAFRRAPEPGLPGSVLDFQPYEPLEAYVPSTPTPEFGMRVGEPYAGFVPLTDLPGPTEIPITPDILTPATAVATAVHTVSSFANAVPILGALGAVGGIVALGGGSGGGGGGGGVVPPPIVPIIPAGPAATPEPNAVLLGLALLSTGAAGLLQRRRKQRK
jgi:hypothetical protein